MKKASDPRHTHRIKLVEGLFSHSFAKQSQSKQVTQILKSKEEIDKLIEKAAPEWPIEKIAKIDLAILRLGVYELMVDRKEPDKVIIDEAIEIAKLFGNDKSPSFINGVLGTILKIKKQDKNK